MTTHRWLDRPWWKRGLLHYLYLVVIKDSRKRVRRIRVLARLALRWIIRRWTGRYLTVLLPDQQTVMRARVAEFIAALTPEFYAKRRENNRDLLTGMVVALTAGHRQYMTGWERYKFARQRRSNYQNPIRVVGRPVVYTTKLTKIGMTDWHFDFTPRREQLETRKRLKRKAL